MTIRFFFDVEAEDLQKDAISFGYCVAEIEDQTKEILRIIEKDDCHSIEGAQNCCDFVKESVLPKLSAVQPYLKQNLKDINAAELPPNVVKTKFELRERFFQIYQKYASREPKVEFWTDVGYPVETNFLAAIVRDGKGERDLKMPFPLYDLSSLLHENVSRKSYCQIPGLQEHNPLHDALAILYSLSRFEQEILKLPHQPAILQNFNKPKLVFDVGAKDLQKGAFGFGYIVTTFDGQTIRVLEKGQFYSIKSAQNVKSYVRDNSMRHLKILHTWLERNIDTIQEEELPPELLISSKELREKFYSIYNHWQNLDADIYAADVMYPVEANFLSKIVKNDEEKRSFAMPYPLYDIVNIQAEEVCRREFTGLKNIQRGNPLHHAITSSCTLYLSGMPNSNQAEIRKNITQAFQELIPKPKPQYAYSELTRSTHSPIIAKPIRANLNRLAQEGSLKDSNDSAPRHDDAAKFNI